MTIRRLQPLIAVSPQPDYDVALSSECGDGATAGKRPPEMLLCLAHLAPRFTLKSRRRCCKFVCGKNVLSFGVIEMMVATLVLAAVITLIVYSQSLVDYLRSLWKSPSS
jgi:hypothetical protein